MNERMVITQYCFVDEFIDTLMNYPFRNMIRKHWEENEAKKNA
jgi:hypothetical protein